MPVIIDNLLEFFCFKVSLASALDEPVISNTNTKLEVRATLIRRRTGLPGKLTVSRMGKTFLALYGSRMFITVFKKPHQSSVYIPKYSEAFFACMNVFLSIICMQDVRSSIIS
jgi:hypothetical protein